MHLMRAAARLQRSLLEHASSGVEAARDALHAYVAATQGHFQDCLSDAARLIASRAQLSVEHRRAWTLQVGELPHSRAQWDAVNQFASVRAARCIQRNWMRYMLRQQEQRAVEEAAGRERQAAWQRVATAAMCIQCYWRRWQAARRVAGLKAAAVERRRAAVCRKLQLHACASRIQVRLHV